MHRNRLHRRNYNEPGHAHSLTFSCYRRYKFLQSDRTCRWLLDAIDEAREKMHVDLWGFVVMPEHAHLIVHPRDLVYDIADVRRAIKAPVGIKALQFLAKEAPEWLPKISRQRGGHLERLFWQSGGGYDRNFTEPRTLLRLIEYVHLNPVRRGLVERAGDWHWSSAVHYLGWGSSPIAIDPIPPEWGA